jgi:hypothetical protein
MSRRSRTATVAATTYPSTQKSATSSSGGIALPSFLFQPGATNPIAGVYTTFGALAAVVAATPGMSTIYVDLSHAGDSYTFPAGNFNLGLAWAMKGLLNPATNALPTLNFLSGTTFTPPAEVIVDDVLITTPQAGAVISHVTANGAQYDLRGGAALGGGGGSFVTFGNASLTAKVTLHDLSSVQGAGSVTVSNGAVNFECLDKCAILTGSIGITGGTVALVAAAPGISIARSYNLITTLVVGVPFSAAVAPGGSYSGAIGCLYCNTAGSGEGTFFYVKTTSSGSGGWEAVG